MRIDYKDKCRYRNHLQIYQNFFYSSDFNLSTLITDNEFLSGKVKSKHFGLVSISLNYK